MNYTDIHTHNKIWQAGVTKVINVFPCDDVVIDEKDTGIFTAGVHPWNIDDVDVRANLHQIETCLKLGIIKGVGEAGLDGSIETEQIVQENIFKEQIRISENYKCPLIVHCVKRYSEILTLRKKTGAKQPWILHGFNSSVQMMIQMVESGVYISLGSGLLKGSDKIVEVCRQVPSNYLFLETDDSEFLIEEIYEKAAEIREQTVEELKEIVYKNYKEVF